MIQHFRNSDLTQQSATVILDRINIKNVPQLAKVNEYDSTFKSCNMGI